MNLLLRAVRRCEDCWICYQLKTGQWICDGNGKRIEENFECGEWENQRGDLDNPEWN